MPAYADLGDLSEDVRIDIIGRTVMEQLKTVAFIVDDDEKADRYALKLGKRSQKPTPETRTSTARRSAATATGICRSRNSHGRPMANASDRDL